MVVVCGPRGLPMAHNALYHNNRDGTFTDVSAEGRDPGARRAVWARRRDRGFRQRRLAGYLCCLRPDAQPALSQQTRRDLRRARRRSGRGLQCRRPLAGGHGHRGRGLRRQRFSRHRQDKFLRRPAVALQERGWQVLRRRLGTVGAGAESTSRLGHRIPGYRRGWMARSGSGQRTRLSRNRPLADWRNVPAEDSALSQSRATAVFPM